MVQGGGGGRGGMKENSRGLLKEEKGKWGADERSGCKNL